MYIIKNLCIFICMISGVKLEVGPDFNCTRYDSTLGDVSDRKFLRKRISENWFVFIKYFI